MSLFSVVTLEGSGFELYYDTSGIMAEKCHSHQSGIMTGSRCCYDRRKRGQHGAVMTGESATRKESQDMGGGIGNEPISTLYLAGSDSDSGHIT